MMTDSRDLKQDTVLTEEYTCPKCNERIKIPYEQRGSHKTFQPKIFCSKCHKDISQPFSINLASQGIDFRKSTTVGKLSEKTSHTNETLPEELVTFQEALEKLSHKQRVFVVEYIKDFNGSRAALVAGYSKKNANVIASQNLIKLNISYALRCFFHERKISAQKTVEDIEKQIELIAFTNITDIISFNQHGMTFIKSSEDIPVQFRPAIESVEFHETMTGISVKVKMRDSIAALKLLGQQKGMFQKDKKDNGKPIETYEKRRKRLGLDKMSPQEAFDKMMTEWAAKKGYQLVKKVPEQKQQGG